MHVALHPILIADNNLAFRQALVRFLHAQLAGLTIIEIEAEPHAPLLRAAESAMPRLLLLDIGTPGRTDLSVIASLRLSLPSIKIIALGLLDVSSYAETALAAGADAFIAKPQIAERFAETFRLLCIE